jgi:hypothetical protein
LNGAESNQTRSAPPTSTKGNISIRQFPTTNIDGRLKKENSGERGVDPNLGGRLSAGRDGMYNESY